MSWNKEGQRVSGVYLGAYTVSGTVTESRVRYGGTVQHTVKLDAPVEVFGRSAEVLLLDDNDLFNVPTVDGGIEACYNTYLHNKGAKDA